MHMGICRAGALASLGGWVYFVRYNRDARCACGMWSRIEMREPGPGPVSLISDSVDGTCSESLSQVHDPLPQRLSASHGSMLLTTSKFKQP
eukprot:5584991-Prymnesium_polylepis.1